MLDSTSLWNPADDSAEIEQDCKQELVDQDADALLDGGVLEIGKYKWEMRDVIDHAISSSKFGANTLCELLITQFSGEDNREQIKAHLKKVAEDLVLGLRESDE